MPWVDATSTDFWDSVSTPPALVTKPPFQNVMLWTGSQWQQAGSFSGSGSFLEPVSAPYTGSWVTGYRPERIRITIQSTGAPFNIYQGVDIKVFSAGAMDDIFVTFTPLAGNPNEEVLESPLDFVTHPADILGIGFSQVYDAGDDNFLIKKIEFFEPGPSAIFWTNLVGVTETT